MKINEDGTKTVSYNKGGMVTTKTIDKNGKVIEESTEPYVRTAYTTDENITTVEQSPMVKTIKRPTQKVTSYTFNDGQEYTGYETDWEEAARKAGNTSGLKVALSYPEYVDKNESLRYLNEMADKYGVDLEKPVNNGTVYTKEEGVNIIPDYKGVAGNNALKGAERYRAVDLSPYFESARNNALGKFEADKSYADDYYDALKEREDDDYIKRQQEAYLSNYFAGKKAQEALLENGIKGGLAESSIIKNASDFENNYNDNLSEHMEYLKDIEAKRAKAYADMEARLNEYFAEIDIKEAEMAQQENENYNDYALKAYLAQMDYQQAERERLFKAQQAEEERAHEAELKMMGLK